MYVFTENKTKIKIGETFLYSEPAGIFLFDVVDITSEIDLKTMDESTMVSIKIKYAFDYQGTPESKNKWFSSKKTMTEYEIIMNPAVFSSKTTKFAEYLDKYPEAFI